MSLPKLVYDQNCPICVNYVRMIRNKIGADQLEMTPGGTEAEDFTYIAKDTLTYKGGVGIDKFAEDFPDVLSYFWMLPAKFKSKALQAAYKVGSAARNYLRRGGCGCGGGNKK